MADEIATYLNDECPNGSEEFFEAAGITLLFLFRVFFSFLFLFLSCFFSFMCVGEDQDKAKEMARKTFVLARATCMWPEIQWPADVENEDIQHFDGDLDGKIREN